MLPFDTTPLKYLVHWCVAISSFLSHYQTTQTAETQKQTKVASHGWFPIFILKEWWTSSFLLSVLPSLKNLLHHSYQESGHGRSFAGTVAKRCSGSSISGSVLHNVRLHHTFSPIQILWNRLQKVTNGHSQTVSSNISCTETDWLKKKLSIMAAGEFPCCSVKYHQQGHSRKRQLTEEELLLLSLLCPAWPDSVCEFLSVAKNTTSVSHSSPRPMHGSL